MQSAEPVSAQLLLGKLPVGLESDLPFTVFTVTWLGAHLYSPQSVQSAGGESSFAPPCRQKGSLLLLLFNFKPT